MNYDWPLRGISVSEIKLENDVQWDGECLLVWAVGPNSRIRCEIPRETIHHIRLYSDAITREIARDKEEIIDRLGLHNRQSSRRRWAFSSTAAVRFVRHLNPRPPPTLALPSYDGP
jgi:hypothetical protein